ncbi:MAG: GntR family transcriptional regulator [Acidimicrobiales bacterium]|nr:GntR family transcriptional regulator [Acidimicrobiales bacterium]
MSKRALTVVDLIELSAAERGWKPGLMLGDETTLMNEYGAGRSVLRQAIRLAEHLGVASMRRGRSGGLTIAVPSPGPMALSLRIAWSQARLVPRAVERLEDQINDWVTSAPPGAEVVGTAVLMASERYRVPAPAPWKSDGTDRNPAKLGEQIASQLLASIFDEPMDADVLGSEAQLMKTHHAGRAALREAVHILELHGAAAMQRGPGGGLLILHKPTSGAIPRSLRAQLRSKGLCDDQICLVLNSLLVALPDNDSVPAAAALRLGAQELRAELAVQPPLEEAIDLRVAPSIGG